MADFLWDLFVYVWKSEQVRIGLFALVVIAIGFLGKMMLKLKDKFEEHVSQETVQFVEIKKDITTIKDNHLAHLARDVEKLDKKLDKLVFHLMGSSSDDESSS